MRFSTVAGEKGALDDYTQAGNLWRVLDENQKNCTALAIAGALTAARQDIQMLQCHFFRADADYGQRVARALRVDIDSSMLRQNQQNNPLPINA